MSFYQFLTILNAHKKIALFAFFVTVLTTVVLSLFLPKTYEAQVTLVINSSGADPVTGMHARTQLMPGYMATQVKVLTSRNVALKVVDKLNLHTNVVFVEDYYDSTQGRGDIRNWVADIILRSLFVTPLREGGVIVLSYRSSSPETAALMANAFADAYINTSLELKISPSQRTASWFKDRVEVMRTELIESKEKLSKYQREKGIVSLDERLDVEKINFSQLSQQLVAFQTELFHLESKYNAIKGDGIKGSNLALLDDDMIKSLRISIATSEVKRVELRETFSVKHPKYKAVKAEILSLNKELKVQMNSAFNQLKNNIVVVKLKIKVIKESLDKQKEALLSINENRDVLDVLTRDVEDANYVLSLATKRLSQIKLEGSSKESSVSVLNPAIEPIKPIKPNVVINTILAIFFGLILAIGLSLLIELVNRRVRVVRDITVGVDLPVLGEVKFSKTRKKIEVAHGK